MSGVVGGPGGAGGGAVSRQAGALPPQDTRHPLHGDLFKLISTDIIAELFVCFKFTNFRKYIVILKLKCFYSVK